MSKKTYNPRAAVLLATMAFWQVGEPLQAADRFWDPGITGGTTGGGTGTWDNLTTSNWWDGVSLVQWNNPTNDLAIFGNTGGLVTLGGPITAGGLRFNSSGYTVTGDTITLAGAATLQASLAESATINSLIGGSSGLTMLGGGSIRLGNALNSYTGATTIANGSLIISDGGALGTDPSVISILSTNTTPLNNSLIGFGGGSLVLDGTTAGFTFGRNVNLEGRGPLGDRGAAILSLGNNTLSGVITTAVSTLPLSPTASIRNSRINSVNGTLTLTGTLSAGGTSATTFTMLGGVNQAGVGNYSFGGTGTLAGTGSIEKSGGGTLFLNSLGSNTGFTGTVRVGGSATGQQSSVRVTDLLVNGVPGTNVFGSNAGTNASATIDLNGGVLEIRSDASLNFAKQVYGRGSSTTFVGNGIGGTGVNGTATFGAFRLASNNTQTFNSRNGYGVTFGAWTQENSNNNATIANGMGGTLTFTDNAWNNNDASNRTLTFDGNGNTVITGSINTSGTGVKSLTKNGTGSLEIRGVGTTLNGSVNISGGAVVATDFRSLNNNTANINIGSGGTSGALILGTSTAATGAGLTTSKVINLAGSTGGARIFANQSGASPVILNANFTATGGAVGDAKTLVLGGTNGADNIINGIIPNNAAGGTVNLNKVGAGTWVLAGANTYSGATTIQNGTLKLRATGAASDVIASTAAVTFNSNGTTGTAGGILEFRGFSGLATTETLGALTPTAGASTIRLLGNGAAANLTFTSLGATTAASSLNFDTSLAAGGAITLTGQAATTATNLPGSTNLQGHLYINGANFATINASAQVEAPTYGAAGNFREAGPALVAATHNKLTAATATAANTTISSLLTNSQTLTLGGNLIVSTGGILQSGGTASILSDSATARLIQGTAAGTNVAIRVDGASDVLNLGSATNPVNISNVTTAGLTKNGAGTLVVFGTNAQTGTTTINEGKVSLDGANARLSATTASLVVRQGATLELLTGVTDANAIVNAVDGSGTISGLSGQTFTQNGGGTWKGVFSGTGFNITKGGAAATWSGLSTYTGVTTIGGTGLVTLDNLANGGVASGIGASTNAAGNLVFTGTTAGLDYRGSIIVDDLTLGSRSASTDRLFTLGSAATGAVLSSTVSNNNAMVWSNTGAIGNDTIANAVLTLTGTSAGDNILNPQLVDSSVGGGITLGVTKTGTGIWKLGNSSNTYTGATTISQGILQATDGTSLPTASNLVLDGGSLYSQGTFNRNFGTGAGEMRFATTADTAQFSGFVGGDSKLTVAFNGNPVWDTTANFLTERDGLILNGSSGRGVGTTTSNALSEVEITGDFSLGTAAVAAASGLTYTTANNSNQLTAMNPAQVALLSVGQSISGDSIPAGAYITAINGTTSISISANAPGSGNGAKTNGAVLADNFRTIRVDDNGLTGADFATISGVISAGDAVTGLQKVGGGILRLTGANTYGGATSVREGTLTVRSLSGSTGPATSSVGAGGVAMTDANAITLGNGAGTAGVLQYAGAGETSDRKIRLNTTTGSTQIHADGSGPLVLTNVANDMAAGAKTLFLRGTNTAGNMISSVLADNGGTLGVTVDGGASWILTAANTYTGVNTASAGALGIGNDAALGTGGLTNNNGNVFAYGADRTLSNVLALSNNATNGWQGDYSLTFSNPTNLQAAANNVTTNNNIVAGKTLTLNGVTANALTDNRAWIIDGAGETVINGDFTTSTAFGVRFDVNGGGTLNLGTNGATSNWNQRITAVDVDRGTLAFSANNAIPTTFGTATGTTSAVVAIGATTFTVPSTAGLQVGQGFTGTNVPAGSRIATIVDGTTFTTTIAPTTAVASGTALTFVASGGLTISPELATSDTARVDLRGTTQTVNALTATSDGTVVIDNTSSSPAAFRFGAGNSVVNFGSGIGSYTIQDSGTGALSIVKLGNTSTTFGTGVTLNYQGATRVEGGTLTLGGLVGGTSALEVVNSGSVLALTGGIANASGITSVVVEDGGTLSLLDGNGNKLDSLTSLTLGSTGGTLTNLNLNVGDGVTAGDFAKTDTLKLLTGGALSLFASNQIQFNLTDAGLNENTTYTLLEVADGGLTTGPLSGLDYLLGGAPGGFASVTLNKTNNAITFTTGALITGDLYWTGTSDNTWNGNVNNWSTDKAGTLAAASLPGQGTDLKFVADSLVGGAALTTTLEQNFKIRTLTFEGSTTPANTPGSVTINSGTVATNRLEIAPGTATNGISLTAGGPAVVNLNSAVTLGKSQTWSVAEGVDLTGGSYANGSANVTVASTAGLRPGMVVSGPGIPLGTTVASVTNGTQFVLSANTTAASVAGGSPLTAAQTLNVGGALDGAGALTKTGLGRVVLGSAASPLFASPLVTVNGGQLEMAAANALGSLANGNLAAIQLDAGGTFYYNNATGATVANPLTLNGGTLSAGGANHTYSGAVNAGAGSTIQMLDPRTLNAARNITLSGVVSGSGAITVDSVNTVSGGNQLAGTLTLNNAGNTWSGDLLFNRGTVTVSNAASPNFLANNVTFNSFGRLNLQGLNGATQTRTGTITYGAGVIGEFGVDNTGATVNADYTVDQAGALSLGAGSGMRVFLADAFSKMNLTGGVTLAGNGSISLGGDAAGLLNISSVISDGGSGFALAINDDLGGWGTTNRTVRLSALNTFTGNFTLGEGVAEYDTVTNISGGASSLGNGTAITISGGNLRFIGSSNQATDRPVTTTTTGSILSNNSPNGSTLTFNGLITNTGTADGSQLTLGGLAGNQSFIRGGISQTLDTADLTVNGGTWNHELQVSRIGDDVTVTGATTVLNLNSGLLNVRDDLTVTAGATLNLNGANALSFNITTLSNDASLRASNGGIINLGASDAIDTVQFDGLRIGTDAGGDAGVFNMGSFNQTVTEFLLGNRNLDRTGTVNGTGTLTITGNVDLYEGEINANLASTGTNAFDKIGGNETVFLRGDNSGLASTGASAVYAGTLALDYTVSNTVKLRELSTLDMRGGKLQILGNNSAATTQTVAALTLGNGGASVIEVDGGTGQTAVLNFAGITRGTNANDGTIRFILPSGVQDATNGITTTAGLTNGLLGISGFATVEDGTGTYFATTSGTNVVGLISTPKNDITTWVAGDHITDETTGFTGTSTGASINSLRFNAAVGSDVNLTTGGSLGITTGGILVTSNVAGNAGILGGTLASGALGGQVPELIITQDSAQRFEISSTIGVNHAITKSGNGTLRLSGTNTYTGYTDILQGTLEVSGGNAIGDSSVVILDDNRDTTFRLLNSETIGRLEGGRRADGEDNGIVDIGANTLTLNHTGANTTFNGRFVGSGGLVLSPASNSNLNMQGVSSGFTGALVVNGGLFQLSNVGAINASSITINGGGNLLLDNNGGTRSGARILDTTPITLNSANGAFNGTTVPRGLAIRTDQNANTSETVGNLTFDSGANYASLEHSGGTSSVSSLIASGWTRNNSATINVRGRTLGDTANGRSQFKVADANDAAMIAANVGGGAVTTPLTVLTTSGDPTLTLSTGTTAGLVVGQGVFGTGIGAGATIVSIDSLNNQITVSVPSTATSAAPITATAFLGGGGVRRTATVATVATSATLTLTAGTTAGFAVGQAITGTGIGAGATIVSIDSATQLTVSVPSTATSVSGTPITATAFSRNNPIIPWAIGENLTAGLNNGNVGNTFMTYVDNVGLRPLDLTNEYATFGGAIPTDNIRESLAADLTGLTTTTLNSLVINNNNAVAPINVTGAGALETLTNTSGAFLFTVTGGQANTNYSTTLGGFDAGIQIGTTNEYVIHVVNPSSAGITPELTGVATNNGSTNVTVASTAGLLPGMFIVGDGIPAGATVASVTNATTFVLSANAQATATGLTFASTTPPGLTATIASPLASTADITKSGRGTLVLNQVNTAGGGTRKTTINEGTLEIADLDNMGGDTGALVFAGGALRLATGFADDLSLRTISLLSGGGTLDTNGNDVTLANSLGSGGGGFTKAGAGNLTLNSAATFSGPTVLNAGTITLGASDALGLGGDLTLNGGTTLALGNFNLSRGLVTLNGLDSVLTGTGTISASTGFFFNNTTTDTLTNVDAVLAGAGGLRKAQGNTLVLNGLNTYAGATEIQAGAVNFSSIGNVGGGASSFGAPTTVANGIIRLGLTTANVVLNYSGTGHSSDRVLGLQGTTGGVTLNANGTGGVNFGVVSGLNAGAKTLTLDGSADAVLLNSINGIVEGASTITLVKNGLSTWAITGAGTHSGLTTVNGGILKISNSTALGSTTNGTVIADGATLQLEGGISVGAETLSITGMGAAGQAGALVNLGGSNSFAGPITALSPLTISLEGGALTLGALTGTDFGLTAVGPGDLTVGGDLLLGTGAITKNNTGLLVLSGNNVFTGGLALNAGTVEAGSAGALGSEGTITLAGGTLRHGAANTVDYSARFSSGDGTAYKIETAGQSVTYATPLTGAGSTLSKAGAGTLVLNAVNTFDGRTTVTGGALSISSEENLGAAPAAFVPDQLLLDGGTLETTANFAIDDTNRGITLGALGGTFFTAPSTQLTLVSQMTGAGQLTKDGAGTLLLSTASSHTGGTLVVNGKLLLGVNDAITGAVTVSGSGNLDIGTNNLTVSSLTVSGTASSVSGTGSITSAANFAFSPTGTATISNVLAGTGGITMSGTGTAILTGDNTYTGATTISSGALLLGGGSIASIDTVSVASAATFGGFGEVSGPVVLAAGTGYQAGEQALLNVGGGFRDGLNVLDLNGDLTAGANSIIDFYLTRTGFTQLDVAGMLNLDATTRIRVNLDSGYIPSAGSSWDLLNWGAGMLNIGGGLTLTDLLFPLPTPGGVGVPDWVTTSFNTDGVLSIFGDRTGPAITTDPVGGVVNAGDSVTFSIAVTGSDPLQIQWYKGPTLANPIPGANGLTYTIPSAAGSDSGEYWAQVKNGPDTVNSQLAVLDVVTVPRITVQPQGSILFPSPGQDKTFNVTAIGPGPLTYVWKKATVAISGAPDDDEFTINGVQVTDSGNYTVTVSNSFGEVTSDVAVLTVNAAIAFTTQPQTPSPAVPEGNDFTLTAVVTGEGPFTYQWEFDPQGGAIAFAPISGAESPTLTRNVQLSTLGNYRLVVNNAYTSLTSNQATIGFGAVQVVVTSQPISKIVAVGSTLTLDVGTSGGKPQKFQWFFKNKAVGDETDATLRIEDVTSARAGEYFCRISNALVSGSTTVDTQRVMVAVVDRKPGRFVVTSPSTVSLSVVATSDTKLDPLTFQWFVDEGLVSVPAPVPVPGATAKTLKVTQQTAGRKRYFCRVSGGSGSRFLDGGDNVVFIYTQPPQLQPEGTWDLPDTMVSQPYSYQVPMVPNPLEPAQPDPLKMPVSFKATGLPPGLTINSAGLISGRATVEKRSPDKTQVIDYTVTITATNKLGTTTPIIKSLRVEPLNLGLIGAFTGPVDRNASLNKNLGGVINFTTTKTGTYSGKLTMGASTYSFKGALNTDVLDQTNPSVTVKVSRGTTLRPLLVSFKLNSAGFVTGPTNLLTRGTITDGRTIAEFDGWRNTWLVTATNKTPALAYSGYYTMGLDIPLPLQGTTTNPTIPQGTGYASFTVSSSTGKMTVSGKLADGTAFTTATYVGPTGEVLVFKALYGTTATSTRGSVLGKLQIDQEVAADTADNTLTGTVSWWKVALTPSTSTAGRTYAAGFGPFDLSVAGSRYVAPAKGFPVLGLAQNATTNNARLILTEANSETAGPAMTGSVANSVDVKVDNASKVFPNVNVNANARKVSVTFTASTGLMSFKYTLSQAHPFPGASPATITRAVTGAGMIVRSGSEQRAWGYHLLPQLPSNFSEKTTATPILSGHAVFEAITP